MYLDEHKRSLAKTLTWRVAAGTATFAVAYLISEDSYLAAEITLARELIGTLFYYAHERVWNNVHWGKVKV